MSLVLNDDQTALRDSARAFLDGEAPVAALRALRDAGDTLGHAPALWQRFAEMGYSGILVPEAHGGLGLGHAEIGIVMEEIGRHLSASPLLATGVVAVSAIRHGGSAAQQAAWLPALAAGERTAALAVDEHPKHRPDDIATSAVREGAGWRLDGGKTFVVDGHAADLLLVAARTADGETALFALERGTPGPSVERVAMVDARPTARLTLSALRLPAEALLGSVSGGSVALSAALDAGRAAVAAELLGIGSEVFERTLAYLKERRQFDRLIGEFQALQHRMAVLYGELELARSAVLGAQRALDADPLAASAAVSLAKAAAGKAATLAVQEGVQLHGGMGMTDAFDLGFFMKRARVLQELWGDAGWHADALARRRGY
jgi:alkylation response protein AidB-like acyl-CoA dehydrogenase